MDGHDQIAEPAPDAPAAADPDGVPDGSDPGDAPEASDAGAPARDADTGSGAASSAGGDAADGHASGSSAAAGRRDGGRGSSEGAERGAEGGGEGIGEGSGEAGEGGGEGEESGTPGKKRRRPRRDPHEPYFGALFLDELQRVAGLRGQFSYGVPAKLWYANREVMIRILREEVPMPTFKNQIQCILHEDPYFLAQDVHYEMLRSATPPEDSFRWLWLFMMLR